jgi:hypothetical protein
MQTRTASCACGALTVACEGEPALVSACHCLDCQRRTGSAFGVAVFFAREKVHPEGASKSFSRTSDTGSGVTFHFCRDCGSTVWWEPARKPDVVAVALGAFADPTFPAPIQAVFEERKHPWVTLDV